MKHLTQKNLCFAAGLLLALSTSAVFGITATIKFLLYFSMLVGFLGYPFIALALILVMNIPSAMVFYTAYVYQTDITGDIVAIMTTSTPAEKWIYLTNISVWWYLLIFAYVALSIIATCYIWKFRHTKIDWRQRVVSLLGGITFISGLALYYKQPDLSQYIFRVQPISWMHLLKTLYFSHELHNRYKNSDAVAVTASQIPNISEKQIYMLVIGESAQRDRHSLYGYDKYNTNPLLSQRPLILYSDVISTYPHTVYSVLSMVTKKSLADIGEPGNFPSFMSAFRAAGFKTYWLSNQAIIGKNDSPISAYAIKSDFSYFTGTYHSGGEYDEHLLEKLDRVLQEQKDKKLIIIHLYGSHIQFEDRYPTQFNLSTDPYDNTILYTDYILSKIIDKLEKINKVSALAYISDHGIHVGECGEKPPFYSSSYNYQIPLFIWTNPQWKSLFPEKYNAVINNVDKKITIRNIYDSMLGLANIQYEGYQAQKDIFHKNLTEEIRWVKTYSKIVDYDKAVLYDVCDLNNIK